MSLERFIRRTTISIVTLQACLSAFAAAAQSTDGATPNVAVGAQYDSSHVYVAKEDFDRFTASFVATFGGTLSKKSIVDVTPTASETASQIALTPAGTVSVFGFQTPIPYPFGIERYGYLVTDLDAAVSAARTDGASIVVAPFADPIGRDAIVEWPGGVYMQLYWHTIAPHYAAVANMPEDRVYVAPDNADTFVRDFVAFSHGSVSSDDRQAPGIEIGLPGTAYRRITHHLSLWDDDGHRERWASAVSIRSGDDRLRCVRSCVYAREGEGGGRTGARAAVSIRDRNGRNGRLPGWLYRRGSHHLGFASSRSIRTHCDCPFDTATSPLVRL
jgi:hypothetical protein